MKIGIVGCGNMGAALTENLVRTLGRDAISIFDKDAQKQDGLVKTFSVRGCKTVQELLEVSDTVIIAVKPQDIESVLDVLKGRKDKLIVSIAAGKTIQYLESRLGLGVPISRNMPNLNAMVGASTTGSSLNLSAVPYREKVRDVFESVGVFLEIKEELMNAFTAIAGSGPAFIAFVMDVMKPNEIQSVFVKEALAYGFDRSVADTMAAKTIEGTQKILKVNFDRGIFIKKVCSKGGTTEAGMKVLEEKGKTPEALSLAIRAAERRAQELSGS
jgi:pyrroline-5-carboxylate reductase